MALLNLVAARAEAREMPPFVRTIQEIRSWLDAEGIEPVHFKTVVGKAGLAFEISFRGERDAQRFQERFASLLI